MRVIGINGSARKDGNTSLLIQKVFNELNAEGIETNLVNLGPQSVNGCLACMKCFENQDGHCIQKKDKLNEWLDEMKACDGIILGTPVYFADISGQLKCFMDRSGMVAIANGNIFKRKVGVGVVAVRRAGSVSAFHSINSEGRISVRISLHQFIFYHSRDDNCRLHLLEYGIWDGKGGNFTGRRRHANHGQFGKKYGLVD
ncbi:MAG: flavodoxin family protein [Desulfobacterales bacterium]